MIHSRIFDWIEIHQVPKTLHSGDQTNVFFPIEKLLSNSEVRNVVLGDLSSHIYDLKDKKVFEVMPPLVGIVTGGAYVALCLARDFSIDCFFIEKDGTTNLPRSIKDVILIDDVVTTGNSLNQAKAFLEGRGHKVIETMCVIDRREMIV
jgi:orotate phosphoribosyltransferase